MNKMLKRLQEVTLSEEKDSEAIIELEGQITELEVQPSPGEKTALEYLHKAVDHLKSGDTNSAVHQIDRILKDGAINPHRLDTLRDLRDKLAGDTASRLGFLSFKSQSAIDRVFGEGKAPKVEPNRTYRILKKDRSASRHAGTYIYYTIEVDGEEYRFDWNSTREGDRLSAIGVAFTKEEK